MSCAANALPKHGIRPLLGEAAWGRLPAAVRQRFADPARRVDYVGSFEIVRASALGIALAWICRCLGTPVVPRTGVDVPAIVHVVPTALGVAWRREYRWPERSAWPKRSTYLVRSTKTVGTDGILVERLPACLCMPLEVFETAGALHFVSRGYYFDLGIIPGTRTRLKLGLPSWLSPGVTHVEHIDEAHGWFRFTLTVTHALFGEVFYQTGRFSAAGG
jgi:hypothetical protein